MAQVTSDSTVRIHRALKAPADRVYRAFLDPHALCRWMPPYGYIGEMHQSDMREGGEYRMSFRNFRTGDVQAFGGKFVECKPNELIRYTDKFEDPNLPGELQVTVKLREVICGTELNIIQENIPKQIPVEMCYLGWQESLMQLAKLVEAEVP